MVGLILLIDSHSRRRICFAGPALTIVCCQVNSGSFTDAAPAIEINAWPAKADGMLALAPRALHFELPYHRVLATALSKDLSGIVFAWLMAEVVPFLLEPPVSKGQSGDRES
jgi:hypothetical protein